MKSLALALFCVAMTGARAAADSKPGDYLTDDGKLKEMLQIRNLQGGVAGLTGRYWQIEPSGAWTSGTAFRDKLDSKAMGTLTKEQLATLAAALAKYDLATLERSGTPKVNPHVVRITWGKKTVELSLGAGAPLPKVDAAAVPGRFSGIVEAVRMLTGKDKTEK